RSNYHAEHEFTAGWIALRFLHEPGVAAQHFARTAEGNANPITIARAGYWLGRTAEAMNRPPEARARHGTAARYSTAQYGQPARPARPRRARLRGPAVAHAGAAAGAGDARGGARRGAALCARRARPGRAVRRRPGRQEHRPARPRPAGRDRREERRRALGAAD